MPDLVLELLSEEIPARMQARAAADLERLVNERLLAQGYLPEGVKAFAGPRRLSLVAAGLPGRQADRKEEKKGPRVGAPEKAIEGFLKSAGLASLESCEIRDDKKGQYYVAVIEEKGRETAAVIAAFMPELIRTFPWPKSMRWGDGDLRWVRPLKSILCVFDGEVVPFAAGTVASADRSAGHPVLAPQEFRARTFEKYEAGLRAGKVMLDAAARSERILREARTLCEAQGLELVEDKGLLAEVAGLAEWPVPMMGAFDEKFLAVPDEVLTASMRGHQKYFSVRNPKTGRLANRFVFVANIEAEDGGQSMRAGYERVLTARLSDAWYLYHRDLRTPLGGRVAALDDITFFEGLGSVGDKARRVAALAREIAPAVGADPELAAEAARLAKADLVSLMVREFPELQGVMGRYYHLAQGALRDADLRSAPQGEGRREPQAKPALHPEEPRAARRHEGQPEQARSAVTKDAQQVADAIRDHYKPQGADDDVPTAPVSVAVALADKIDTLTAFWAIGKKPTGSSDPFALRRAALGVISIVLEVSERAHFAAHPGEGRDPSDDKRADRWVPAFAGTSGKPRMRLCLEALARQHAQRLIGIPAAVGAVDLEGQARADRWLNFTSAPTLLSFFHDRLKVYLRDKDHRHDHIDAVLLKADGTPEDDLVLIVRKLEALEAFLKTDDGANLAAGYKRAANILKAEEKKGALPPEAVSQSKLQQAEEKALYAALLAAEEKASKAVASEKFEEAMAALASLRAPIDAFFDKVTVNADDPALRSNRLALLARLRAATATVADLSKLEG